MVIMWVVFVIFLILSVVLLSGRGGFLISGYNTADLEKKAKYNEKKLCRVTGTGILVITIMLFIMAVFGDTLPDWFAGFFIIATFIDVIIIMVVSNTLCYAKNPDGSIINVLKTDLSKEDIRRNNLVTKWSLIFTIAVFVIVGVLLITGDIKMNYNEDFLYIEASYWNDMTIDYDEIETMEYREGYLKGSRSGGFESFRLLMGVFENKEFGSYIRYTYTDCHAYIILTMEGKKNPVIIAGKDKPETEKIYSELLIRTGL